MSDDNYMAIGMKPEPADTWSTAEEARFIEMHERRKRALDLRRQYLRDAATPLMTFVGVEDRSLSVKEEFIDIMIQHAGELRDALEPFAKATGSAA